MTGAPQTGSPGLIIRQKEPANLETPLEQVDSYITPTELFYLRSHFPAPSLELESYQLRITGAVRNPLSLTYQELRGMPSETRVFTLNSSPRTSAASAPTAANTEHAVSAARKPKRKVDCSCSAAGPLRDPPPA